MVLMMESRVRTRFSSDRTSYFQQPVLEVKLVITVKLEKQFVPTQPSVRSWQNSPASDFW